MQYISKKYLENTTVLHTLQRRCAVKSPFTKRAVSGWIEVGSRSHHK